MKNRRILMSLIGVVLCGISVGIYRFAALGVDPFTSLVIGMDGVIPLSYGTVYALVNLVLLSFALVTDRSKIGLATFINLFLLGYIADGSYMVLNGLNSAPGMALRLTALLIGTGLLCLSLALYITADLGVSTYDAVGIVAAEQWHLASFGVCRIVTDIGCLLIGVLLCRISAGSFAGISSIVGVGTVLTAFCMGPMIEFFSKTIARPLLNR